jgi:hypothetical protein
MGTSHSWTHVVLLCAPGLTEALAGAAAASALKTHRPDCRVTCVVGRTAAPLLERQPAVDQTVADPSVRHLVAFFRQQSSSLVVLLSADPLRLFAAVLAGVPVRICCDGGSGPGTIARMLTGLFGCRQDAVETSVPSALRIMGLPSHLPARPWIVLTPRERRRARRRLRSLPRSRVLVHPSCLSGAIGLLRAPWSFVLADFDRAPCAHPSLAAWLERGVLDLLSTLSLREWLAVLMETDVLVSANEESLFLADAMGVPTVRVTPAVRDQDVKSILPEAVVWQVEAILRHRLRIVDRAERHHTGVV